MGASAAWTRAPPLEVYKAIAREWLVAGGNKYRAVYLPPSVREVAIWHPAIADHLVPLVLNSAGLIRGKYFSFLFFSICAHPLFHFGSR